MLCLLSLSCVYESSHVQCRQGRGGAYCEPTCAKIHGHSIDLIALEEVDLNPECGLSSQSFWRSCGWFSSLSLPVGGFSRSAIPSRFPLQPVGLGPDVARVASALVEVRRDGSYFKFCFVGFYGHSGQCANAAAVLETVCSAISPLGMPYVLAGDFQFHSALGGADRERPCLWFVS